METIIGALLPGQVFELQGITTPILSAYVRSNPINASNISGVNPPNSINISISEKNVVRVMNNGIAPLVNLYLYTNE